MDIPVSGTPGSQCSATIYRTQKRGENLVYHIEAILSRGQRLVSGLLQFLLSQKLPPRQLVSVTIFELASKMPLVGFVDKSAGNINLWALKGFRFEIFLLPAKIGRCI